MILSRVKSSISKLAILLLAMVVPAVAQTSTSTVPSASTQNTDTRTVADRSSQSPQTNAAEDPYQLQPGEDPENHLISPFVKHLVGDQKQFWTSPARFRTKDLKWILPAAGVTAAFIASDSWWSKQVNPSHMQTSLHISDYGTYSMIGLTGASFLFGHMTHDDHLQEAGLLTGEAAINATGVAYLFKEMTQRQRPLQDSGNGDFFKGGSSFPSEHSAIAWSVASVWAHEYPGWLSQTAAYGLASAITITRVTAKQHFPSDVIVGSAFGWYFGRQVYRAHHDPELGGTSWGSLLPDNTGGNARNPNYMASPYVPLDSWIYPSLERLIAMGYMQSNMLGMRPWTRMACAQMLEDAGDKLQNDEAGEAGKIYRALASEFATEITRLDGAANVGARVDSVYTRATEISGTPLRDGFNFGQTIINDYGRPYGRGFNNITGVAADAELGPVAFSFQGEYQHAPAMPSDPPQVLAAIGAANFTPPLPNGTPTANQFQLINSAVLLNIDNVQFSFGEQSEWLGPGESGSLLMSNNAAPFPTFKIDDVAPHNIPGLSRVLGPFRTEFFIGQLSGQQWELCTAPTCQSYPGYPGVVGPNISPQPFIHGEKISFQPTPNLEFGMGVTAMFGGPGLPVTFGNFFRTYYIHSPTAANNPGKRISAADFTYRVPGVRNWLTFYMDSLVVDEISPIGSTRANVNPGIYMPQIPKVPKLEFRAEGINESRTTEFPPGFVYSDFRRYLSGYTNDGNLLANWIGRAGRGEQGWLTYSFSPRTQLQLGYRLQGVSKDLIGGGRLVDYSATGNFMLSHTLAFSGLLQYEQWMFPVLSASRQSNVTASVQLTYYPKWQIKR
ncbi:MAG TPA: capsule assembly Wzi family protein [Terriglobales bacterium]|nr:capsule assembly Wzi family protein [Terriglobales bacterium]